MHENADCYMVFRGVLLYKIRQYNCTKIYMTPSERRVFWATIYSKNHGLLKLIFKIRSDPVFKIWSDPVSMH